MRYGSGKTNLPKSEGSLPLIIADENKQIIYGLATAEKIREVDATLTQEERKRLPAPAIYLAPISIEIFISYLRIRYGYRSVVRRRFRG
jgi:hypothetical protein